MKEQRQAAIRELLKERAVQTQEELVLALRQKGFQVTQATVSRDIRELRLRKISSPEGGFRYAEPDQHPEGMNERLIRLLRDCVISTECAGQMVIVKTMSGAANTAAEALDSMEMPEIAGSIAGDNTIFLVGRDHFSAQSAAQRIADLTDKPERGS